MKKAFFSLCLRCCAEWSWHWIDCHEERRAKGAWCPLVPFLNMVVNPGVDTCSPTGGSFRCSLLAGCLLAGRAPCPSGAASLRHLANSLVGACLPLTSFGAVHSMHAGFCIFNVVVHFSFFLFSHFPHAFSTISVVINPLFFLMCGFLPLCPVFSCN